MNKLSMVDEEEERPMVTVKPPSTPQPTKVHHHQEHLSYGQYTLFGGRVGEVAGYGCVDGYGVGVSASLF